MHVCNHALFGAVTPIGHNIETTNTNQLQQRFNVAHLDPVGCNVGPPWIRLVPEHPTNA